ncbi:hypothetical protein [Pseudoalteromonas sp.]|uniref:hypothetical protein n=1 Tax=Pseudoalteromonas sp. TaxID=53249 RepID=UPI0030015966
MKIISAKLNKEPYHSLTKKDVKLIFSLVPNEWISDIKEVVIASEMFSKSRFDRPVIYSSYLNRLKIISRGYSKIDAAKEVLRELGVNGGIAQTQFANHIPKSELVNLDKVVAFYLSEFCAQLEHNK